jgi:ribosomal protein S18 acetylase RimI-like enzyme
MTILRPLRWVDDAVDDADLAAAARVYDAFERDRIGHVETGRDELAGAFGQPHVPRSDNVLLLQDDEVAGCVFVEVSPTARDLYSDVAVLPGPADRERLEVCVRHVVDAARRAAAADGRPGWTLHLGCLAQDATFAAVLAEAGLVPVRRFYRMRIASDSPDVPAVAPVLPDGVQLVVRDDEETRRTIWEVVNASFAGHWNFTPRPWDDWWQSMSAGPTRDPEGWWLLTVDGEPAGVCLMDDCRAEFGEGYVMTLGVLERFRGRGLASLMLRRAFVRYRDLGRVATQLDVDASNETGAVGVYERVGMTPIHVFVGHTLELT